MSVTRMQGTVGFVEDVIGLFTSGDRACMQNILPLTSWPDVRRAGREILRRVRLADTEPDHMPIGRSWPQGEIELFSRWIDDGTPKVRGEAYASLFRDLDAVTEYFDVYGRPPAEYLMPKVMKYFGRDTEPGRRKALNLWREYSVIPDDDPAKAAQKELLDQELGQADVSTAIKSVDSVLVGLMRKCWSNAGAVDLDIVLDACFRFGSDRLPEDMDRLARIKALNDPDDFRLGYALYHRMDSLVMWMNWMGHVECAVSLYGKTDIDHGARTALLAGLCLGYSADCVFRSRGQTRKEYYGADGADRMWRKSVLISNDFDKARSETHALAQLRESTQPPGVLLADKPVRFNSLRGHLER